MPRSWVQGSSDPRFRLTSEYRREVNKFIEYAFSNASCKGGRIVCPCTNCINHRWRTAPEVLEHLVCDGFLCNYTEWTYHGEGSSSSTLHHDNIVAQILVTLKEKIGEKTEEEQANKTVHESVFKEVLGSDSHGRVRLYGTGVKSSQVFGIKAKQIEEQNVKIREQNEKIKKLEESMQAQEEFNRIQGEYMKKMDAMLQLVTSELHASQLRSQSLSETQLPSETQ